VLDLDGKLVMPGLYDMHVHPSGGGLAQFRCMIAQGSNAEESLAHIAGCVVKADPGEWIDALPRVRFCSGSGAGRVRSA